MIDIKGKKITIIGAQRSGKALTELALRLEGIPRISELKPEKDIDADLVQWFRQNRLAMEFNGQTREFIEDSDIVVLSPGVSVHSAAVQWATLRNIPVLGEIEFAFQFCHKPVIAVTGSNGKTTVSTLINLVLTKAGYRSILCGNVGFPFSQFVFNLADKDFIVVEMSSFQLESLLEPQSTFRTSSHNGRWSFRGFKPHIAVMLNLSQNHLDRHKDLNEYYEAKKRIFLNQEESDFAVLNYQNSLLRSWANDIKSKAVFFGANTQTKILNENYAAVMKVADILGVSEELCQKVFDHFKGVEHRLEWVRSIKGVEYINDSKSTTAEATRWALTRMEHPVILLCGGRDKNIDFSVLKELVQKKVKSMIVFGEARTKIKNTFAEVVKIEECRSLEEAVASAQHTAQTGDCVVLSPMCASFDMFRNFEERGKRYKEIVNQLN